MENMEARFRIVFEKLPRVSREKEPAGTKEDAHRAEATEVEIEAIAELCRLSAEIAQPPSVLFTTT
ncbi:MAG: hypothetical protein HY321_05085 [Armatimonadetes bacterium]|nr:hypothetical protein [Armatimonadota bacterium]